MKNRYFTLVIGLILLFTIIIYTSITNFVKNSSYCPNIDKSNQYDVFYEFDISNPDNLYNIRSIPVISNEDPGENPDANYFGMLGKLVYPLQNVDISNDDIVLIIIEPSDSVRIENFDAYVANDITKILQSKEKFCYFKTPKGTTPISYISIYVNGIKISKDGVFGAHLSYLSNEFKPVNFVK